MARDRIRFNVGGKMFETTTTTLAKACRNSMLGALVDDDWNHLQSAGTVTEYFIDRSPACFSVLLDLLRSGELHVPPNIPNKLLQREALYYGLLDHVRAAQCGAFDGNLLQLSRSVSALARGDGTAIRASPEGGCCVAHGSMVNVYDWLLEEHPPISLNFQQVNDIGYIDSNNIVVTAREMQRKDDTGMAVFSSSDGELRHRFRVSHESQFKRFTAGALSFSGRNHRIFASCKGRCNEYGIGVWDPVTGEQTDFFYDTAGCSLGDADRLQWLDDANCLMVATLFPRTNNCFIGLLDIREKSMVWSWTETAAPIVGKRVLDATSMEDGYSICVVNQYEDLGFIDLRSETGRGVRWRSGSNLMKKMVYGEESCYPKLATHGGQLFSSMNDCISVFCGREWELTSSLRRKIEGSICDLSIGGGRLFALHGEGNVFDVWEALPPPII